MNDKSTDSIGTRMGAIFLSSVSLGAEHMQAYDTIKRKNNDEI
jgi:hypothetical protein